MPIADIDKQHLEVSVIGSITGAGGDSQVTVTPLHYMRLNSIGDFSPTAFITAFHAAVKAAWRACASEDWSWEKTICRCINSPTEAAVEVAVAEDGTVAEMSVPGFVAAIIAKKTPRRGRSYQGRIFFPGLPVTALEGNVLSAAHVTLLGTLRTALLGTITEAASNSWVPGVLSRKNSILKFPTDPSVVDMTQITTMPVRTVVGRQSQRKSRII